LKIYWKELKTSASRQMFCKKAKDRMRESSLWSQF